MVESLHASDSLVASSTESTNDTAQLPNKHNTIADKVTDYKCVDYWNQRFSTEPEYDWLVTYPHISSLLSQYIDTSHRILIIGCGNSTLSYDLYNHGYKNVISIDYSQVVIDNMRAKYSRIPELRYYLCDMTQLHQLFPLSYFDIIIDKASIDSMIVDQGDPWNPKQSTRDQVHQCVKSIRTVLSSYGIFIQISWQQPHFRINNYINRVSYAWNITTHTFNVNDGFDYFMYVCQRDGTTDKKKNNKFKPKPTDTSTNHSNQHIQSQHNNTNHDNQIHNISNQLHSARLLEFKLPSINGLYYMDNFITQSESDDILKLIDAREWSLHVDRRQQFFGETYYHTLHDLPEIQPVTADSTTAVPHYPLTDFQWLIDRCVAADQQYQWGVFNGETDTGGAVTQVLVNEYIERQGIASHVDDFSAFGDYIITISLLQPIYVVLQRNDDICHDKQRVLLQPNSICIKTRDARYKYTHGITHSKFVEMPNDILLIRDSSYRRVSLTIRKLLHGRKKSAVAHTEWNKQHLDK